MRYSPLRSEALKVQIDLTKSAFTNERGVIKDEKNKEILESIENVRKRQNDSTNEVIEL